MTEIIRLGDLVEITNGYAFKSSDYIDSGIRIIRITNVQKGSIVDNNPQYYPLSSQSTLNRYSINEGDILMSLTGNVGRVGRFPAELLPAYINQRVCRVKSRSSKLSSDYLFYVLNSDLFERDAIENSAGVAQLNLSTKWIEDYKIALPPLAKQHKIAEILDTADSLRKKDQQLVERYTALSQSLFLEMFGDPVTNPLGWNIKIFSELANNLDSKRMPVKESDRDKMRGNIPYYGATGIVDYINNFIFDGEHLLIAEDGKNLVNRKKPIAWIVSGKFWVNNHAHIVKYNGYSNLWFLQFLLNKMDISNYVTGIDQFKMNKSNLDRIPIITPPIELQNQFAERIKLIEAQKQQAQRSLDKSEALFNSLLQRAFTGELMAKMAA